MMTLTFSTLELKSFLFQFFDLESVSVSTGGGQNRKELGPLPVSLLLLLLLLLFHMWTVNQVNQSRAVGL